MLIGNVPRSRVMVLEPRFGCRCVYLRVRGRSAVSAANMLS